MFERRPEGKQEEEDWVVGRLGQVADTATVLGGRKETKGSK